jgi:polysaccharide biosynthesis/export protein
MMRESNLIKYQIMKLIIVCFACLLTANISFSQLVPDTKKEVSEPKLDLKSLIQTPSISAPALECPVDPDKYYVGPSDVISVNIWTSLPVNFTVTVTPEGTLIVPTVGEVRVVDLTLREAKKKIITEIKKKYALGEPTVTLLRPRSVVVTIIGAVAHPGKYTLDATEHIDRALAAANKDNGVYIHNGRNIRLTHRSGEFSRVDIPKYYITKDDKWNPLLRDGDELFVVSEKSMFAVYGAVNAPGSFEFIQGDSLLDAIELAYGFTSRAIKDSIVLYRYNFTTGQQDLFYFKFDEIKRGSSNNPQLVIGDRVIVKEQSEIRENYQVFVNGEIKYPGIYPLTKDSTKLTQVINWCGGFTEYASLASAQVYRGTISKQELEIERLLSMRGNMESEDSSYYILERELRARREIINVDFEKLFVAKDTTQDIYLKDGDYVSVPSIRRTIYVFGQVVNPGNIPFIPGKDYMHYIEKCGNYTDNARSSDVMIIKSVTRQWLSPSETTIEEGDYIWVPKKISHSFAYYMNVFSQTAAVITAAVSIALLWIQLKK